MSVVFALGGALILMLAGDALVRGAVDISLKFGLSAALVSLTVVAMGTSLPELVISLEAALTGSPDIALGNVVGSNIANILLVLGAPALLIAMRGDPREMRRGYWLMLGATLLFALVAQGGAISALEGALLLLGLAGALVYSALRAPKTKPDLPPPPATGRKATALIIAGIVGLPIGAHLLIEGARDIALSMGVSEAAIGLTLVALGTSLPELAASVAAAWRGRAEMIIGNVLGSNMMNLLMIVGATALVAPLEVAPVFSRVDIPLMAAASLLIAPFMLWGLRFGRTAGLAFVALYAGFAVITLG